MSDKTSSAQGDPIYGTSFIPSSASIHQGDGRNVHNYSSSEARSERELEVLRSLYFDGFEKRKAQISSSNVLPGCYDWLKDTDFWDWLSTDEPSFWISGQPGSGKSTLMVYLCSSDATLKELSRAGEEWLILNYFFDFRAGEGVANSLIGILRCFIYQILSRKPEICKWLVHHTAVNKLLESGIVDDYIGALHVITSNHDLNICAFVDGLDEYKGNNWELCSTLAEMQIKTKAKMCLASRPEPILQRYFRTLPHFTMQDFNQASIQMYVKHAFATLDETVSSTENAGSIEKAITNTVQKAEGMFLWVTLVMNQVLESFSYGNTLNTALLNLEQFPLELERVYDYLLEKASRYDRREAALALFVLNEMNGNTNAVTLIQDWKFLLNSPTPTGSAGRYTTYEQCEARVRALLGGLIVYESQTDKQTASIRFVHTTLRQYLVGKEWFVRNLPVLDQSLTSEHSQPHSRQDIIDDFSGQDRIANRDSIRLHAAVANDGLLYLKSLSKMPSMTEGRLALPDTDTEHFGRLLAQHAAKTWWQHLSIIDQNIPQDQLKLATEFLLDENAVIFWTNLYNIDRSLDEDPFTSYGRNTQYTSPLYFAAVAGISQLVTALINRGIDVNVRGGRSGTPIAAAISRGHSNVVRALLEAGATVHSEGHSRSHFTAPTDSGYYSMKSAIDQSQLKDGYAQSIFSGASDFYATEEEHLLHSFARRLLEDLHLDLERSKAVTMEPQILNNILLEFSLRIAEDHTLKGHIKIAGFLRSRRSHLVNEIQTSGVFARDISICATSVDEGATCSSDELENDAVRIRNAADLPSVEEKIGMWSIDKVQDMLKVETDDPEVLSAQHSKDYTIYDLFKDAVYDTFAYRWLVAVLRSKFRPITPVTDLLLTIRETLYTAFPKPKALLSLSRARFEIEWPLRQFLVEQVPDWQQKGGIDNILTLTMSLQYTQATTCAKYVLQTWPVTGTALLRVLNKALMTSMDAESLQPGCVDLSVSISGFQMQVEVGGTSGAIIEVAEMLCWLSSVLNYGKSKRGIEICRPNLMMSENFENQNSRSPSATPSTIVRGSLPSVNMPVIPKTKVFTVLHSYSRLESSYRQAGKCWHALFQRVTVVEGFPVLIQLPSGVGLEISLGVVGDLMGTRHIAQLGNVSHLKAPFSILEPVHHTTDTVIWHLRTADSGKILSYQDVEFSSFRCEQPIECYARHIVGWSQGTVNLVGSSTCNYDIRPTSLRHVGSAHPFHEHARVSNRPLPVDGICSIPKDDRVPDWSLPLPAMIRTLLDRTFCFWDLNCRRGYLVSGTNALAHVLRASIKYDEEFPPSWRAQGFEEPADPFLTDAARDFLCNPANMSTAILQHMQGGEMRVETFEERSVELFHTLEQISLFQRRHRKALRDSTRALLEAWDFYSIIRLRNKLHRPRCLKIPPDSAGWVDLIREAAIPVICGIGFGELLLPQKDDVQTLCPQWETLPSGQFYLATSMKVLLKIAENSRGCIDSCSKQLTRKLDWIAPGSLFECCGCQQGTAGKEHIQVVLPKAIRSSWTSNITCKLSSSSISEDALVVFGHNDKQDWYWPDLGSPRLGPLIPITDNTDTHEVEESTDGSLTDDDLAPVFSRPTSLEPVSTTTASHEELQTDSHSNSYGGIQLRGSSQSHMGNNIGNTTIIHHHNNLWPQSGMSFSLLYPSPFSRGAIAPAARQVSSTAESYDLPD